jgi:predicted small lipoprotein YifL
MKKILALTLALIMLVSLCACGAKTTDDGTVPSTDNNVESQPVNEDNGASNNTGNATSAALSGKINIINLDDRDSSILRGMRITGNCAGTAEGFNSKESSLDDVRCIFELNEWVEFYPDTDAEYALRVWILKHRDDQEYYNDCKFSDLMPGFVQYCDLHYPADEENPDNWNWGSFYLNKEECEPGYYDFVFTYEGKAIATLLTRFYAENELTVKSDAELEALMHE